MNKWKQINATSKWNKLLTNFIKYILLFHAYFLRTTKKVRCYVHQLYVKGYVLNFLFTVFCFLWFKRGSFQIRACYKLVILYNQIYHRTFSRNSRFDLFNITLNVFISFSFFFLAELKFLISCTVARFVIFTL